MVVCSGVGTKWAANLWVWNSQRFKTGQTVSQHLIIYVTRSGSITRSSTSLILPFGGVGN